MMQSLKTMVFRRCPCLSLLLLVVGMATAASNQSPRLPPPNSRPQVELLDSLEAVERDLPWFAQFAREQKIHFVDLGSDSVFSTFAEGLIDLTKRLVTSTDKIKLFHLVLVDDMRINAALVPFSTTAGALLVNTGILHLTENDDMLAAVIAHEINHGNSDLQVQISKLRTSKEFRDKALATGLQRPVENEVDARAMERLHVTGFNPHAVEHMLAGLRTLGHGSDKSHTLTASRQNTIHSALTALKRAKGYEVKADLPENYTNNWVGPARAHLKSQGFRRSQLKRLLAFLKQQLPRATSLYQTVVAERPRQMDAARNGLLDTYWRHVQDVFAETTRLTYGILTAEEKRKLELPTHIRMDRVYEQARSAVIPLAFGDTVRQLSQLLEADHRYYPSESGLTIDDLLDLRSGIFGISNLQRDIAEMEADLSDRATITADRPAIRERILAKQATLESKWADYQKALEEYEGTFEENDRLILRLSISGDAPNLRELRDEAIAARKELKFRRKKVGDFERRNEARTRENLIRYFAIPADPLYPPKYQHAENFDRVYTDNLRRLLSDFNEQDPQILEDVFNHFTAVTFNRLDTAHRAQEKDAVLTHFAYSMMSGNDGYPGYLFTRLYDLDPKRGREALHRLFGGLITRATHLTHLEYIFDEIAEKSEPPLQNPHKKVFKAPYLSETIAQEVLLPLAAPYFSKLNLLFDEAIYRARSFDEMERALRIYFDRMDVLTHPMFNDVRPGLLAEARNLIRSRLSKITTTAKNDLTLRGISGTSTERVQVWICAREPRIYRLFDQANPLLPMNLVRNELISMSRDRAFTTQAPLKHQLKYANILQLAYPAPADRELGYSQLLDLGDLVDWGRREGVYAGPPSQSIDAYVMESLSIAEWIAQHRPERIGGTVAPLIADSRWSTVGSLDYTFTSPVYKAYSGRRGRLLEKRARTLLYRYRAFDHTAAVRMAFTDFWAEFYPIEYGDMFGYANWALQALMRVSPDDPIKSLEFFIGYFDALEAAVRSLEDSQDVPKKIRERFAPEPIYEALEHALTSRGSKLELIVDAYLRIVGVKGPTERLDSVHEKIWRRTESRPELRKKFRNPSLVEKLHYGTNRVILAKWQLEQDLHIEEEAARSRARITTIPSHREIRPVLHTIRSLIDRQFKSLSGPKNEVISWIEQRLLTNQAETSYLAQKKITDKNWAQIKQLVVLDAPEALQSFIATNYDRYEILIYVLGFTRELPQRYRSMKQKDPAGAQPHIRTLNAFAQELRLADAYTRVVMLQSFLDPKSGLLSEERFKKKLLDILLGKSADDQIVRTFAEAYLGTLPLSEAKTIIAYALGASIGKDASQTGSAKRLLEAMGPFGIKIGQFLRTSGVVSPEFRVELDDLFDNALPPERAEVIKTMEKVFGKNLGAVAAIRQVVGSGSINYVVLAELFHPTTGRAERAVVRVLRETTAGQVGNENAIWLRVTDKLRDNLDPKIQKILQVGNEARLDVMQTLSPEGSELNAKWERDVYPEARQVYTQPVNSVTGFDVVVGQPIVYFQKLVPAELQNSVSVYRFHENVPLRTLLPTTQRNALALQIVSAEFKALFEAGQFDPDGHPGNWLIDTGNKHLVRIDYAKMKRLTDAERISFKNLFAHLLTPSPKEINIPELVRALQTNFEFSSPVAGLEAKIALIIREQAFPSFSTPHERLFFIRSRLDDLISNEAKGRPTVTIRLTTACRSGLSSIARTMYFREFTGHASYYRSLLAHLGLDTPAFKLKVAQAGLLNAPRALANRINGAMKRMTQFGAAPDVCDSIYKLE